MLQYYLQGFSFNPNSSNVPSTLIGMAMLKYSGRLAFGAMVMAILLIVVILVAPAL